MRRMMLLATLSALLACDEELEGARGAMNGNASLDCAPGADQSCNDDPCISSLHGHCNDDFTCTCEPQFMKNPATGRRR